MSQLQVTEQKLVPFGGAEILAVKTSDGKLHAAVKWVCTGIGLSEGQYQNQSRKIQQDLVVTKGIANLQLPTNGGLQEVLCIELDFLPLWLAKISITPNMQETNHQAVENLITYQLKAKDVLAEAFLPQAQPTTQAELIAMIAQQGVEQERRLNQIEQKTAQLEQQHVNISRIVALNPNGWRDKVNTILNRIAQIRGGGPEFQKVRNESYELLESRANCKLSLRLENRKKDALARGILSKSKIDKIQKLDVIASDVRLTEIYLAIVKEMAIAYEVNFDGLGA